MRGAALGSLRRFRNVGLGRHLTPWNAAEVFLDFFEYLVGLDVARDTENRIVRSVVMLKEGLHILDVRGVQIPEVAVEVVRVWKPIESLPRQIDGKEQAVRLV